MADGAENEAVQLIRCDVRGQSAICGSGGLFGLASGCATGGKPASSGSVGHLGLWIPRDRLLVVDSLAAHSRDGSERVACALEIADQGNVLSDPP
jgi:hypothetical protein